MPTLSDVAKACNVSPMTVSCVLNNKPGRVSATTRERVLRAVRELNYHPNAIARGLMGKRLSTLGVVYLHTHEPTHTSESFVLMLDGILDMATRLRQDTLMCTSYSWQDGVKDVSRLLDRRCDGLIVVVPTTNNPLLPILRDNGLPTVLLCSKSDDPAISSVDTDNVAAARRLIGHVLSLGHRRVALVRGPCEDSYLYCVERVAGYRLALEDHGLPYDPRLVVSVPSPSAALEAFSTLPADVQPTTLFGITDNIALGLIAALEAQGRQVPDDVSVVGFDGIPRAAATAPGLTTVCQPLQQIGRKCVELLLSHICGETEMGRKLILPTELMRRGSLVPLGEGVPFSSRSHS